MRRIAGVAGSALMLGSMGAGATLAFAQETAQPEIAAVDASQFGGARKTVSNVEGAFSFDQDTLASKDAIARALGKASARLCGSSFAETAHRAEGSRPAGAWIISIGGEVENAFSATLDELAEKGAQHVVMGCSCGGNPAGGTASANAEVEGVPLQTILETARPNEGANTIVFTSSDGYEVALPLFCMRHHYALIASTLNEAPLEDSIGGTNQLWLGSTSAFYFARDIVSIDIETRQTPPPVPGTEEAERANLPNVSVTYGGESR